MDESHILAFPFRSTFASRGQTIAFVVKLRRLTAELLQEGRFTPAEARQMMQALADIDVELPNRRQVA